MGCSTSEQTCALAQVDESLVCAWIPFSQTPPDTGTGWSAVMINTVNGIEVAKARVPGPSASGGAWSDGSLMLNPGMGHGDENHMSNERHRSMFSLWCTMGFNLLLTGNLSALNPYVMETYSNPEVGQRPSFCFARSLTGRLASRR